MERAACERLAWLHGQTGIEPELMREVASLLEASEKARDFLTPGEILIPGLPDSPEPEND
jgi:hypothetical protein